MYELFNIENIRPEGWIREQLQIQAAGLSGNLDKIWPDVRDSAWIGGDREGWERVPYWLDGFIPLAWLLDDADLKSRAQKYMTAILERQQPDGWICPIESAKAAEYDVWALFLIGKVMAMYGEFTGSAEVTDALRRAMKCLYEKMASGEVKLFSWGEYRWFEGLIPLLYLKSCKDEPWLTELAIMLHDQGADYPSFTETWKEPINHWKFWTHIVNIGMMFKFEPLYSEMTGGKSSGISEKLWKILEKYNGTVAGVFTGDECLGGLAANRGTEFCSVVELMYSCEWLYRLTGKTVWLDRLERAAFNALPATLSDDMWTHQYDQQVNQASCIKFPGKSLFGTNSSEAHLFGLEPNYGCCTANFNQGWPKFALHAFLRGNREIVCAVMLPETVKTEIDGVPVELSLDTEYPFRLTGRFTVRAAAPVKFALRIHVPAWSDVISVNGELCRETGSVVIEREWAGENVVTVEYHAEPKFVARPYGLKAVEYGPLVYALPIDAEWKRLEYERDNVKREFPYCDYELYPQSGWEYAFASEKLTPSEHNGDSVPFSSKNPRVTVTAELAPIHWEHEEGYLNVPARKPKSANAVGDAKSVELFPYGCAKLRMTEMPKAK